MKRLVAFVIVLTLCVSILMTSCGSAATTTAATTKAAGTTAAGSTAATTKAASGKKVAYFISLKIGGAAWSQAQKGFETAIKELGWDGYFVAPTTANDASQMANLFETALTNKANAILGPMYSKDVFSDMISRARKSGVVVGCTNVNLGGLEDFWIGTDPAGSGRAQAKALTELVGKETKVKVVYMVQDMSMELQQVGFNAFKEGLKDYPNIIHIKNTIPFQILGDKTVTGINLRGETEKLLPVSAVFPFIGSVPNTSFITFPETLDANGYLICNGSMETSVPGLYGAGDVIVKSLRQIVTATSDGAIASFNANKFIRKLAAVSNE